MIATVSASGSVGSLGRRATIREYSSSALPRRAWSVSQPPASVMRSSSTTTMSVTGERSDSSLRSSVTAFFTAETRSAAACLSASTIDTVLVCRDDSEGPSISAARVDAAREDDCEQDIWIPIHRPLTPDLPPDDGGVPARRTFEHPLDLARPPDIGARGGMSLRDHVLPSECGVSIAQRDITTTGGDERGSHIPVRRLGLNGWSRQHRSHQYG